MEFWTNSMPEGMSLKSDGHASSLYDPTDSFTLERYCAEENLPYEDLELPVALEQFIAYGLEFQKRFVPHLERKTVVSVSKIEQGFSVSLDSGETFITQRVVLAIGIGYFSYTPPELADLVGKHATHSSQHASLRDFESRDVAVLGAGASALDVAALLHQAGSHPVVVARTSSVKFHDKQHLPRSLSSRLRAPGSGIGPGWHSWIYCKFPLLFHYCPERLRLRVVNAHLGPAGGWFIKDAVMGKVPILTNASVKSASLEGERVHLRLSPDSARSSNLSVDHVIAATGYRVDVGRITLLDESLRARIATVEKTPVLSSKFESSVPGLYFIGAAAANSFGPVQRFAVGARFAARRVSRSIAASDSER
jgi:thioredoxin reductase